MGESVGDYLEMPRKCKGQLCQDKTVLLSHAVGRSARPKAMHSARRAFMRNLGLADLLAEGL